MFDARRGDKIGMKRGEARISQANQITQDAEIAEARGRLIESIEDEVIGR